MFSYYRFLHFVFADETDTYFIESGTGIKFRFYLWYQLCKNGFKEIFFLNGTKQNLKIEFLDQASFQAYQSKPILGVFGRARSYDRNDRVQPVGDLQKYYNWMGKQLRKGRQAFVIPLDVFDSLMSGVDGERFLEELIELSGQKSESTILLTAPVDSEETLKLLTGPVFRHFGKSGRRLCEVLYGLLYGNKRVNFYEALYEELDGAAVFLNVYEKEKLRQLVYAVQYRQTNGIWTEAELEAITDYLYCWCRSQDMRVVGPIPGDFQKAIRFEELFRLLGNENTWKKLRTAAISFYNGKKSDRIETLYPDLSHRMKGFYCGWTNCYGELAKAASHIDLSGYKACREDMGSREDALRSREDVLQFEQFKDQVHTPANWEINRKVEEYVLLFLEQLRQVTEEGFEEEDDLDLMDAAHRVSQIIEALNFSRQYLWERPEAKEQKEIAAVCELYQRYLDISRTKCRYSKKRRQLKRHFDELKKFGEEDAELEVRLEHAQKKEQFYENAEKEAKRRLLHCEEDLEEEHFEAIREVLEEWKTKKPEEWQIKVADIGKEDENDWMQKKYDDEAAKRIADLSHYY